MLHLIALEGYVCIPAKNLLTGDALRAYKQGQAADGFSQNKQLVMASTQKAKRGKEIRKSEANEVKDMQIWRTCGWKPWRPNKLKSFGKE